MPIEYCSILEHFLELRNTFLHSPSDIIPDSPSIAILHWWHSAIFLIFSFSEYLDALCTFKLVWKLLSLLERGEKREGMSSQLHVLANFLYSLFVYTHSCIWFHILFDIFIYFLFRMVKLTASENCPKMIIKFFRSILLKTLFLDCSYHQKAWDNS